MTIAILCSGPSLVTHTEFPADVTIAVNSAAAYHPSDFWVMLDPVTYDRTAYKGSPILAVTNNCYRAIKAKHPECPLRHLQTRYGQHFSSITAMYLAQSLNADVVNVYGMDLRGAADYDGIVPTADRSNERWAEELATYVQTKKELVDAGIEVTRK